MTKTVVNKLQSFFCSDLDWVKRHYDKRPTACNLIFVFLLVGVVGALYLPYLHVPLSFDATDNLSPQMFAEKFPTFDLWSFFVSERHFTWMTLALNYKIWGNSAVAYNAVDYVLHALNAVLIFCFIFNLGRFFKKDFFEHELSAAVGAFFVALFFAIHPVAVFTVAYAVQRFVLLATFFLLITLNLYLVGLGKRQFIWCFLALLPFFLALQSKEQAAVLVFVLAALHFIFRRKEWVFVPFFILAGLATLRSRGVFFRVYEPLASMALQVVQASQQQNIADGMYLPSALGQTGLFFKYFLLWLVPDVGVLAVDMPLVFVFKLFHSTLIIGAFLFLAYTVLVVCLLIKKNHLRVLGFFLFVPLALFTTEFMTVRYHEIFVLYRSYIWFVFFAGPILFFCRRVNVVKLVLFGAYAALLFVGSVDRLEMFLDPVAVWEDAAKKIDGVKDVGASAYRIYGNLGTALGNAGRFSEAVVAYKKSAQLNSYYPKAWDGIGASLVFDGKKTEAVPYFKKAIETQPHYKQAYFNLGTLMSDLGDLNDAVVLLTKATQIDPHYDAAWHNLGNVWLKLGNTAHASACFEKIQDPVLKLRKK